MAERTAISWCHHTFNLWFGCWKIADECSHCYADVFDHRLGGSHWGRTAPRRFFGDDYWNAPLKWNRKAIADGVRRKVFVMSMGDWAEVHPDPEIRRQMDAYRGRLWNLIARCDGLDWLLLTKRIQDVVDHAMLPWLVPPRDQPPRPLCRDCADSDGMCAHERGRPCDSGEPWPHVWLGITAGTRKALRNVHVLRSIPAAVHWISGEPLLENIPRPAWDIALAPAGDLRNGRGERRYNIDWLIIGDESGSGRRPVPVDAVRTARDAALDNGVAFHFKQWCSGIGDGITGDGKRKIHLPLLDGVQHTAFPEPSR